MSKPQKQFISLPKACERIGCSLSLGNRLIGKEGVDFPQGWFRLGGRRVISTKLLDKWLALKHGDAIPALVERPRELPPKPHRPRHASNARSASV
jgi:predicted DNA-binding transcriptional regulator AlpA